jgi:hypothetical protein
MVRHPEKAVDAADPASPESRTQPLKIKEK